MHIDRSKLVGVIDEGTNVAQFIIYKIPEFEEVASHQQEVKVITPKEGWVEQDPLEILETVRLCVKVACDKLSALDYNIKDIVCIGITNQRETTVVWDQITGKPLYHAIVWNDIRTDETVDKILAKLPDQNKNYFKSISGLTISPYFSALKLRWLLDNIPSVKKACKERRCLAGTIDSWLIWNLTGGPKGGLHVTDVTNASRTLLMNIETLNWDPLLTKTFSVNTSILPEIRSSSEIIAPISDGCVLNGIPISGIMGNQQSSLVGQMCLKPGQTKNTYRSGCFLLCNTGEQKVLSTHGLVTTVAYKLGKDKPAVYALEGSVAVAGSALKWLQNNLKILKNIEDTEQLAGSVFSTGDVYFVPSFTGLYAPYWRKDARGIICGLTGFTNKSHLIRAALEAVCFQTRDILEAMHQDCGFLLNKLNVDGKLSGNNLLMQLQSDLCGIPVFRAQHRDTTALGVAMVASQAEGINAFVLKPDTRLPNHLQDTYLPTTTDTERNLRYTKWKMAVERSLGWAVTKKSEAMTDERFRLLASIPYIQHTDLPLSSLDLSYDGSQSPGSSNLSSQSRSKRMRTSFKHHQLRTMKSYFAINQNPDAKDLKQLAQKTGLSKRVLQVWFQNARAKWRRNVMRQDGTTGNSQITGNLTPITSGGPPSVQSSTSSTIESGMTPSHALEEMHHMTFA